MPVFYQRADGSGFYAKARIQGTILTLEIKGHRRSALGFDFEGELKLG